MQTKYHGLLNITHQPKEIKSDDSKPFEVIINDELVYSKLTPINGETGPITFKYSKWHGEPNPTKLHTIEKVIENSL